MPGAFKRPGGSNRLAWNPGVCRLKGFYYGDGTNPFRLNKLLGHSDLKLTERYSHLSESALKEAALRIQLG
jgi:hypothetical protein